MSVKAVNPVLAAEQPDRVVVAQPFIAMMYHCSSPEAVVEQLYKMGLALFPPVTAVPVVGAMAKTELVHVVDSALLN